MKISSLLVAGSAVFRASPTTGQFPFAFGGIGDNQNVGRQFQEGYDMDEPYRPSIRGGEGVGAKERRLQPPPEEFRDEYEEEREDDDKLAIEEIDAMSMDPSSAPSDAPYYRPPMLANDFCDDAHMIDDTMLPYLVGGHTMGATTEVVNTCDGRVGRYRGVWYKYTNSGDKPQAMNATLGNIDAIMAVYEGYDCSFLQCLGLDYGSNYYYYRDPASFAWIAKPMTTYYIWVSSRYVYSTLYSFNLTLFSYPTPPNDECTGAIVVDSSMLPYSRSGSTKGALIDIGLYTCGVTSTSRGVWFEYMNSDLNKQLIKASVTASYNVRMALFTKPPMMIDPSDPTMCEYLSCEDQGVSQWKDGNTTSTVEFAAEPGTPYYILVTGYDDWSVGDYQMQLSAEETPENDDCAAAIVADPLPFVHRGTTVGSLPDKMTVPWCDTSNIYTGNERRGVWYSIVGTGNVMKATVLQTSDNYYYRSFLNVAVFSTTDDCGNLQCVEPVTQQNQYGGSGRDTAIVREWVGQAGVTYFLYVASMDSLMSGLFRLSVAAYDVPTNDMCDYAISMAAPAMVTGTTAGALTNDLPLNSCGVTTQYSRGVWYSVMGMGQWTRASLQFGGDERYYYYASGMVTVFAGSCEYLECIHDVSHLPVISNYFSRGTSIEWFAEHGTYYYLLVTGHHFDAVGPFALSVETAEPPTHDTCSAALAVDPALPQVVSGSMAGATPDFKFPTPCILGSPYYYAPRPMETSGVWHSLTGTGRAVKVALKQDSNLVLAVYAGDDCDFLQCLAPSTHPYMRRRRDLRRAGRRLQEAPPTSAPYGSDGFASSTNSDGYIDRFPDEDRMYEDDHDHNMDYDKPMPDIYGPHPPHYYSQPAMETEFWTEEGMTYHILVTSNSMYGHYSNFDTSYPRNYRLKISEYDLPVNGDCETATLIDATPYVSVGSTSGAATTMGGVCNMLYNMSYNMSSEDYDMGADYGYMMQEMPRRGVWYAFQGTGATVTASLTAWFDTQLTIYRDGIGSCEDLMCIETVHGYMHYGYGYHGTPLEAKYSWTAEPDTMYYLLVAGYMYADAGDYELKLQEESSTLMLVSSGMPGYYP